jgi:hypothetical protein
MIFFYEIKFFGIEFLVSPRPATASIKENTDARILDRILFLLIIK